MLIMTQLSVGLKSAEFGEPLAENAQYFVRGSLWKLVADAVVHEAESAVAQCQAFAKAFVGRHAAGAFDLAAFDWSRGAGVHLNLRAAVRDAVVVNCTMRGGGRKKQPRAFGR
jgi:hypothetical protein